MVNVDIELNAAQVERAFNVIQQEYIALGITKNQERWYRWLRLSAAIYMISFLLIGCIIIFYEDNLSENQSDFMSAVIMLPAFINGISALTTLLLLLMNFKLVFKLYQQGKLFRRYGLTDLQNSLWQKFRPARKFIDYCISGFNIIGILLIVMAFLFIFFSFIGTPTEDSIYTGMPPSFSLDLYIYLNLGFGLVLIAPSYIQRLKQRIEVLADVERLKKMLEDLKSKEGKTMYTTAVIPRREAEQISIIENTQIKLERAQAIYARNQTDNDEYTLLINRDVHKLRGNLNPEQCLKLEEFFDDLTVKPHSFSLAKESTITTGWSIKVPDIGTIDFEIDESIKQIKIVSLNLDDKSIDLWTNETSKN